MFGGGTRKRQGPGRGAAVERGVTSVSGWVCGSGRGVGRREEGYRMTGE